MVLYLLAGLLLGLVPGLHENLVSLLSLKSGQLFQLVIAFQFSQIIPSLLSAPKSDLAPTLLPGQKMVEQGQLFKAVYEFCVGSIIAVFLFIITAPLYPSILGLLGLVRKWIWLALIIFAGLPILREKSKLRAMIVFLVSGVYGYFILNSGLPVDKVLMAHFSSCFGIAGLVMVWNTEIKPQKARIELGFNWTQLSSALIGFLGGLFISLFPAISPSEAAAVLLVLFGRPSNQMSSVGALSMSAFLMSFLSLYYVGKGRMASVENIVSLPIVNLIPYALFSAALTLVLARYSSALFQKIKRPWPAMMAIILGITVLYSGSVSFLIISSLALGLLPYKLGVSRVHIMGSIMMPTILYYLF
ncbi:MAG: hypothetical protein GOU99_03240 [Candidatus Altiarchaeota archaeon]|nr:hypothetical protein [Candidatus Altiarchaeota archaeon]